MEKEIVSGKLGEVAEYSVAFKEGKLVAELAHKGDMIEAGVSMKMSAEPIVKLVVDKIKELVPGKIDDMLLDEAMALLLEKLKA